MESNKIQRHLLAINSVYLLRFLKTLFTRISHVFRQLIRQSNRTFEIRITTMSIVNCSVKGQLHFCNRRWIKWTAHVIGFSKCADFHHRFRFIGIAIECDAIYLVATGSVSTCQRVWFFFFPIHSDVWSSVAMHCGMFVARMVCLFTCFPFHSLRTVNCMHLGEGFRVPPPHATIQSAMCAFACVNNWYFNI